MAEGQYQGLTSPAGVTNVGFGEAPHVRADPVSALGQEDLDEDFAECIAAWQDSGRLAQGECPSYPNLTRRRTGSVGSAEFNYNGTSGAPAYGGDSNFGMAVAGGGGSGSCITTAATITPVRRMEQPLGPVLSVNAGGVMFRTTASTLRKAPFFDSLLQQVADGVSVEGAGANIFVDRSGDLFGYILEYLRSGHWILCDRAADSEFVNALRDEACFYGLDGLRDYPPLPRISEYATVWQFQNDTALYVDCFEQTIREDPDHQGLFRLCKYTGVLPLDQQTCTKRFKATSHSLQSVVTYFAMRGFSLQHVVEGCMVTHTTSADGQNRSGYGTQYIMSRQISFPASCQASWTPPNTQRG